MRANPRLPDDSVNLPDSHPLVDAAQLIAGVVAIGVLVAVLVAYFVDIVLWMLPCDAEVSLVGSMGSVGDEGGGPDAQTEKLQALVDQLASGWSENPYALRVTVLEEAEPNAFAAPGGRVLVTRGLLDMAESENELAFVLGHEIAHFRDRDHLRALGRAALLQLVLAGVGIGGGDVGLLGQTGLLTQLTFNRSAEREADAFGLDLVERHYGHVAGAGVFFERIASRHPLAASVPAFASTHPQPLARAKAVRRLARDRGYALDGPLLPPL